MKSAGGNLIMVILTALTVSQSCIKERCAGCGTKPLPDSSGYMISFSCNYDYLTGLTKSTTSIGKGIKAVVFAFSCGDNPGSYPPFPGTPVMTTSDEWGNLLLNKGEYLFVPKGYYDFYSISENRDNSLGVSFAGGVSSALENNVDYLWASFRNSYIAVNTNICFKFCHSAVLLNIDFTEGEDIKDLEIVRVSLLPPLRGGRMKLSDGIINDAQGVESSFEEMESVGLSAKYAMLPLRAGVNIPVEVELTAKFGGLNSEFRKCRMVIPSPLNGFRGGSAYKFKAKVYAAGLDLGEAVILDWNSEPSLNIDVTE